MASSMQDLPANPTDLRAKPAKEDEKWERFHLIKCKLSYSRNTVAILAVFDSFHHLETGRKDGQNEARETPSAAHIPSPCVPVSNNMRPTPCP